jgi:RNA polymerase sigma factor (sigma-70 family)
MSEHVQSPTSVQPVRFETGIDDMELARRIGAGDRASFELLMRRHNRALYRLARSALRDDAEVEDVLQEVYLSAYRSIRQFRGESALSTWLSRMVLNECLARLRKRARRQNVIPIVTTEDLDTTAAGEDDFPDKAALRAQMRGIVERKLDELPEDFRMVFVLRAVEEMSVEETAASLNIPEATVRSRHFRARSLLRESLAREIDIAERDLFEFGGAHCDRIVAAVMGRIDNQ